MNCEKFVAELDALLDDELAPAEARALQAHAAACAGCAGEFENARRVQARAFALPPSVPPARDLWPEIERRIVSRPVRERPWFRALAASVLFAAVFLGGMLADRVMRQETVATTQLADAAPRAPLPSAADARRLLPAAYVELVEGVAPRGGSHIEQELLQNLLLVNLAIRKIEVAAAAAPSNPDLRELLAGLYAQENRILSQAERLGAERQARPRTTI